MKVLVGSDIVIENQKGRAGCCHERIVRLTNLKQTFGAPTPKSIE